jgi:glycosyltransferase involved in cell wall biosynthesis
MSCIISSSPTLEVCYLNVGLYRTGSRTLAAAFEIAGFQVRRTFPEISPEKHKMILKNPGRAIRSWWFNDAGKEKLMSLVKDNDFLGDGYIPLLCFLPRQELETLVDRAQSIGKRIIFLATTRSHNDTVASELHHWVVEDLERKAQLTWEDRSCLEDYLSKRSVQHEKAWKTVPQLKCLSLEERNEWPDRLAQVCPRDRENRWIDWKSALENAGIQNASPELPVEGILLTLRLGQGHTQDLLEGLAEDSLCKFLVVLALDDDEADSEEAETLKALIGNYTPKLFCLKNPPKEESAPFEICKCWDRMANKAFEEGADWVVLLGDDIEVKSPFHYRAFYRAFLDIKERCKTPFGFGCPWWNDESFPGFPTFPVVGKEHFKIFGSLIPKHRKQSFVNQDLDPYLQRLYLKFGAAPLANDAILTNETGGNIVHPTRYLRMPANGWRDWVIEDIEPVREYLRGESTSLVDVECLLVDVVVPSYRIALSNLRAICGLKVPDYFRTSFIIVVDNPELLKQVMNVDSQDDAALRLESDLSSACGENNIRVRCNNTNLGASATRNRGMDESAAEYVLFLDDDVFPYEDILEEYGKELKRKEQFTVGLVGLVNFPRSADLPVFHAGVLMSYLIFMFEIASNPMYKTPAWGVTANLLVQRLGVRFDTHYAKTGGGEDVDFCLQMLAAIPGGKFLSVPEAQVRHDFWPGGLNTLLRHFFSWAIGDGALFTRYKRFTYRSWPNAVEFFLFMFCPIWIAVWWKGDGATVVELVTEVCLLFVVDLAVDMSNSKEFTHRRKLLGDFPFSSRYYVMAHVFANFYVNVLESGRLYGHWKRGEMLQNVARRFDWHCERLPHVQDKCVRRELIKLTFFVGVSFLLMFYTPGSEHISSASQGITSADNIHP